MDHFAFASLAQIQILLVPVGSITKSLFDRRAAEIRSFDSIPLGDITVGDKDQRGTQRAFVPADPRPPHFIQPVFFQRPIHSLPVIFTSVFRHVLPLNPTFPYRSSDPPHFLLVSSELLLVQLRPLNTLPHTLMTPPAVSFRLNMPSLCPGYASRSKRSMTILL